MTTPRPDALVRRLKEGARREVRDVLFRSLRKLHESALMSGQREGDPMWCLICGGLVALETADGHADECVVGDIGTIVREWIEAERRG